MDENIIYNYNKNGVFIGVGKAKLDPRETKLQGKSIYALPANATFKKSPETKENEVSVFENGEWVIKPDFRGQSYYTEDGKMITIDKIGDTIPSNGITTPLSRGLIKPKYENGEWKETVLLYKGNIVDNKKQVDDITKKLISELDEEKAKTEKLIAGINECPIWDEFIKNREILLSEGKKFIEDNNWGNNE